MNYVNSGYNGYSMSNRACEAYEDGEKPLSKWNKKIILNEVEKYFAENDVRMNFSFDGLKKVKLEQLKDLLLICTSWHHTSKKFNRTNFYSLDTEKLESLTDDDILSCIARNTSEQKVNIKSYRGDIHYIEWKGTKSHPKAEQCVLTDVNIEERGCFYIITDDDDKQLLKKKIGSNGTSVVNYKEREERLRKEKEREENIRRKSSKKALEFFDSLESKERSTSNHIYPYGRKPSRFDYVNGLDKFFRVGEHRLYQDYSTGTLFLETWNGSEWIREE